MFNRCMLLALLTTTGAIPACEPHTDEPPDQRSDIGAAFAPVVDTGITLRVTPLRSEIERFGPAEVYVVVANGIASRWFQNNPDAFIYRVSRITGAGREPVAPNVRVQINRSFGRRADVFLQQHGVIGRVVDLRCIHAGMVSRDCEYGYDLPDPGEYELEVQYAGLDLDVFEARGPQPSPVQLELSATTRFRVR